MVDFSDCVDARSRIVRRIACVPPSGPGAADGAHARRAVAGTPQRRLFFPHACRKSVHLQKNPEPRMTAATAATRPASLWRGTEFRILLPVSAAHLVSHFH